MPNDSTFRMLKKYQDSAPPQLFLSSLFQTPAENFHDAEKVTIDLMRNDPRIAVPVPTTRKPARASSKKRSTSTRVHPVRYDTGVQVSVLQQLEAAPRCRSVH
jgi:hypothetical protein